MLHVYRSTVDIGAGRHSLTCWIRSAVNIAPATRVRAFDAPLHPAHSVCTDTQQLSLEGRQCLATLQCSEKETCIMLKRACGSPFPDTNAMLALSE